MIRQQKRDMRRKLEHLAEGVRPDWIAPEDLADIAGTLARVAGDRRIPIRIVAKIYAAAIVQEGLGGSVDWPAVGFLIMARRRFYLRDPLGLVKVLAWREIRRAKPRAVAQAWGKAVKPPVIVRTVPRPAWAILARFASYAVALALIFAGCYFVRLLIVSTWTLAEGALK